MASREEVGLVWVIVESSVECGLSWFDECVEGVLLDVPEVSNSRQGM